MGAEQSIGGAVPVAAVTLTEFLDAIEEATGVVVPLACMPGIPGGGGCGISVSTTGPTTDVVSVGMVICVIIGNEGCLRRQVTISASARRSNGYEQTSVQVTAQPHIALRTAVFNASLERARVRDFWDSVSRYPSKGLHGALEGMRCIASAANLGDKCLPVDVHEHYDRLRWMAESLVPRAGALMDLFGCRVIVMNPSGHEVELDHHALLRQTPMNLYTFVRETCPMCANLGDSILDKLAVIHDDDTDDPPVPQTFTIQSLYTFLVAHGPVVRILAGYRIA